MISEAIVLAGGFGTRLQKVVAEVPKPMAPVAGKPFLHYIFDYLIKNDITHAVLAVGYLREVIIDTYGDNYRSLKLTYSIETDPLGTGGGIMQACKYLQGNEAMVINGDTFFDVDLHALTSFHQQQKALLSVALKRMENFDRYGTVETNDTHQITGFREKRYMSEGLINGGIYCLNTAIFPEHIPQKFSFVKEILEKEIHAGRIFGMESQGYFIDIGIPEDYARAQDDFKSR